MALRPFSRSDKELSVQLDRPQGPYYPGDALHVTITYQPRKDVPVRELRTVLAAWEVYVSQGSKGHKTRRTVTDQVVAEDVILVEDVVASGSSLAVDVDWRFPPDAMPPYAGHSLTSGWSVRVTVDIERRIDASENVVLPLVVPPPGERVQAGEYGEASHPGKAEMHLWLPGLEWVEGEVIGGKLIVVPHDSFEARQVRVSLIRREQVHAPRLKTSATKRISRAKLAGKTRFVAQQPVEFPFSLDVPELGCPSRRTEHTTVTHTFEAVLGRGLRKRYKVATEVTVYGGRRA